MTFQQVFNKSYLLLITELKLIWRVLLKPQQLTAILIHTWKVVLSNPGQTYKLQWKFSLLDPKHESPSQHWREFWKRWACFGHVLGLRYNKTVCTKTKGLLVLIAIVSAHLHTHPPSHLLPKYRCGSPCPGGVCTISLIACPAAARETAVSLHHYTAVLWPAWILGHSDESYAWLGKQGTLFNAADLGVVLKRKINQ